MIPKFYLFLFIAFLIPFCGMTKSLNALPYESVVTHKNLDQEFLLPPDFSPSEEYFDQTDIAFNIANSNHESNTEIYRSLSPETGFTLIKTQSWLAENFIDRDLKPRKAYYYKLRAVRQDVVSEFSQTEFIMTMSKNYDPGLTAKALNENIIELTFTDKSYNDVYYIIQGTDGYYQEVSLSDSGRTEILIHEPVNPGTTYTYSVDVTTYGEGLPSFQNVARASVTTPVFQICTGAGAIEREVWTGITGTNISSIPLNSNPNALSKLKIFETPSYYGNNYGSRIRGFICVPESGNYTFWIASDDRSELWLSTDDTPVNKVKIAFVNGHTSVRQWLKYPTQKSTPINLEEGRKYYIEALHKEANGADHLAVGWQLPDGTLERPIPGSRLIPWNADRATAASALINARDLISINREMKIEISLYPNPTSKREVALLFSGEKNIETNEVNIKVVSMTGQIVYTTHIRCQNDCAKIPIVLNGSVSPGIYLVHLVMNKKRFSKNLILE